MSSSIPLLRFHVLVRRCHFLGLHFLHLSSGADQLG
ncbi:hypothetical protein Prudu_491S000300 [Prunus dulcis]|uniref:Uncharacterized protein n=1 Tax=Prunus dulcis TaxID=3755 RepID=A0A4Y1RRT7_PRUDU|nr:hypothetical protein Prudu_018204 [Prunus dulcis]BBN68595.1 hypothetical protein Prudu_491S000300 [Prunus dulcis]